MNMEESFCRIEIELFDAIVAYPLDDDMSKLSRHMSPAWTCLPLYSVVPSSPSGAPVMINRDKDKTSGIWTHPLSRLSPGDAEMSFVGFFDFDMYRHRDFQYISVKITGSDEYPEIVGRAALIQMQYATIHKAEQPSPPVSSDTPTKGDS